MNGGTIELLLLVAVVVLAVAAGLLLGVGLRRRAREREARAAGGTRGAASRPLASQRMPTIPPPPPGAAVVRRRSSPPVLGGGAPSAAGATASSAMAGALTVGASERACPSCRTVYQDMIYCQKDARRLVSLEELAAPGRAGGLACPRCGRGFEHGLRRCPHDGGELVPLAMYQATRRRRDSGPTGVLAKVCPVCRRKFDLASRFCGRDGHELVVVN